MSKIYLAIPYSGYEEESFKLANEVAAELIKQGHIVYSPISMSHPIAKAGGLQGNWEMWIKTCLEFVEWCEEIVIVNFNNYAVENSVGCQAELEHGRKYDKIIRNYYT